MHTHKKSKNRKRALFSHDRSKRQLLDALLTTAEMNNILQHSDQAAMPSFFSIQAYMKHSPHTSGTVGGKKKNRNQKASASKGQGASIIAQELFKSRVRRGYKPSGTPDVRRRKHTQAQLTPRFFMSRHPPQSLIRISGERKEKEKEKTEHAR